MACYHPIPALQSDPGGAVRLNPPIGTENLALPCGGCLGCRAARATQWARRCAHEAKCWEHNTFITLTYDDKHLPNEGHLRADDLQRFFKRLRKLAERTDSGITRDRRSSIRYFSCGEYGETTQRPHYHAILFNCGFADREHISTRDGRPVYRSATLAKLWKNGNTECGDATPAGANYIAQYSLKKIGSGNFDPATGEWRPAPFLRMSLKPAIGYSWVDKFREDMRNGYLIAEGTKTGIPRSYIKRVEKIDPLIHDEITVAKAHIQKGDRSHPERLKAEEIIHKHRKQHNERQL